MSYRSMAASMDPLTVVAAAKPVVEISMSPLTLVTPTSEARSSTSTSPFTVLASNATFSGTLT